jgi:hypothetical protein
MEAMMKKRIGVLASGCLATIALFAMAAATTELLGQNKTKANISPAKGNSKSADGTELRIDRIANAIDPVELKKVRHRSGWISKN